jgi:hypothetical protein
MVRPVVSVVDAPTPEAGRPGPERPSFMESLIARVCSDFGAAPELVGRYAGEIVAQFAHARVQSFIPVLVEKQLRDRVRTCPDGRDIGWPGSAR